jgi:hypothetical protein
MPDTVHFNVHTQKYNHAINTGKGTRIYRPGVQNDFHVYSVEWTKDKLIGLWMAQKYLLMQMKEQEWTPGLFTNRNTIKIEKSSN